MRDASETQCCSNGSEIIVSFNMVDLKLYEIELRLLLADELHEIAGQWSEPLHNGEIIIKMYNNYITLLLKHSKPWEKLHIATRGSLYVTLPCWESILCISLTIYLKSP